MAEQMPKPIGFRSGICVMWVQFDNEADARVYAEMVRKRGDTWNGGMYHGRPCGDVSQSGDLWEVTCA